MNITLLVSGSIAAYKSAELVRALVKKGANVQVAMTEGAKEFVTPLTLQTLSGKRVLTNLFDEEAEAEIGHITIADKADLVLLAPTTANVIAKAAHGLADDIVTTTLLATRARIIIAPAMNVNMWNNAATQENIETLKRRGVEFIDPESGELACGWEGEGRLAEIETIVDRVFCKNTLDGTHVVVTAGPTREAIDPIRFVSNRSSGKMGYAIAKEAAKLGATVSLISGPVEIDAPAGVSLTQVTTADEMQKELEDILSNHKAGETTLYMAAAVSDHKPKVTANKKLKDFKNSDFNLEMSTTPDILAGIGNKKETFEKLSGSKLTIVGFAAETAEDDAELEELGRLKLKSKSADYIVANNARDSFEKNTNKVMIVSNDKETVQTQVCSKESIAKIILEHVSS